MADDSPLSFADRLRQLVGQDSVAAFARKCEIGESLMRSYLLGSDPGRNNIEKIWRGSGCSLLWLMTGRGSMYSDQDEVAESGGKVAAFKLRRRKTDAAEQQGSEGREILESFDGRHFLLLPRYDVRVSAGAGAVVHSEQIVDYLAFEADWFGREVGIAPTHAALFEVRGTSMEPDLFDGELALLDLSKNAFVDDAIYVLQYGGALRIKKVQRRIDGRIEIKSSNEGAYKPEVVSEEEAQSIVVIGRAKIALPRVRRLP